MRLRWKARALRELNAIYNYIAQHDPVAAETVAADIDRSARQLKSFPQLGRPSQETNVRLLQASGRPYLLPYRVTGNSIEVLAVLDERMKRSPEWS